MNELHLPNHMSSEAHALFRAYQEVWSIYEPISQRLGEPYWQVARAGIYSILEAVIILDDPELGRRLKTKTTNQEKTNDNEPQYN